MKTGPYVVGRGSYPNSEGMVQLDAAIMRGRDCSIGAVCGLEGSVQPLQDAATLVVQLCHVLSHRYSKPIQVARHIMVHSPHNVLVGSGAGQYAIENGFKMESNNALLGPEAVQAYQVTYQLQSTFRYACWHRHYCTCVSITLRGHYWRMYALIQDFKTSRNSTTAGRTHDTLGKGDTVAIMREYTRASHCSAALCRPTWGCGCWGVYWRGSV